MSPHRPLPPAAPSAGPPGPPSGAPAGTPAGTGAHPQAVARQRLLRLNDLNPYSLTADGWCDPTSTRADIYDRSGPPADPRADMSGPTQRPSVHDQLKALRKQRTAPVDVDTLYAQWMAHPRRDAVAPLFPRPPDAAARATLRKGVEAVRVRAADGDVGTLGHALLNAPTLTPLEAERILGVTAELRYAWIERDADAGYDEINWLHTCAEVRQILDVAAAQDLTALQTEDAVLASLFSDAAKLRGNFLTHHIDGAVAATLVLPSLPERIRIDGRTAGGRSRLVSIAQAILEHQVGPPRFMASMVRHAVSSTLPAEAERATLRQLAGKIADPLNPAHVLLHADGYAVLDVTEAEGELLAALGLPAWFVPHPGTPWFQASSAVIDADSLVNYVTPDGVGKIVAICGPGTPFHDATVFHSIFSCGASYVDAVSVMSDSAMDAVREGVNETRSAIDRVRAALADELAAGALVFPNTRFGAIVDEERVDARALQVTVTGEHTHVAVPWVSAGIVAYWNAALDYTPAGAASPRWEFAKLLRRRVADALRAV